MLVGVVIFSLSYVLACSVEFEEKFPLDKTVDFSMDIDTEVTFHLFTNANKEIASLLRNGDLKSVMESSFNSEWPTKVIVHGWTDSVNTYWYSTFRNNYLAIGNYNMILVNWSSGARREYLTSSKLTRPVGEYLGKFLAFLEDNANMSLSNVHILGHSLGAHIAGIAGSSLSGRVARVTGMDPAGPAFEVPFLTDPEDRLDPTDAKFVDVIHTCSGTAGFTSPIGHADFYPNGGTFVQPGCPPLMSLTPDPTSSCQSPSFDQEDSCPCDARVSANFYRADVTLRLAMWHSWEKWSVKRPEGGFTLEPTPSSPLVKVASYWHAFLIIYQDWRNEQ